MEPFAIVAWVGVALCVTLLGWSVHLRFWVRRYTVSMTYHEAISLPASDGGRFVLRRVTGPDSVDPSLPPVLLVHGLAANHRNLDALPDASLARLLAEGGRDVWLLTLRAALPRGVRGRPARFDAMVRHDVPAAIDAVRARTSAAQVDYVGFSMGGMLLYAALAAGHLPSAHLRRVVTLGSPAHLDVPLRLLRPVLLVPRWLTPSFPFRLAARSVAFAVGLIKTPVHHLLYNPANLSGPEAARAMVNVLEDVPAELNADIAALVRAGSVLEGDRLSRLQSVGLPALFLAGKADRIAPPASVRVAFEAWGGAKAYAVLGSDDGAPGDFGHGDLAVGRIARQVVFPRIEAFLDATDASMP